METEHSLAVKNLLAQMRNMSIEASSQQPLQTGESNEFANVLTKAVDKVNDLQMTSSKLSAGFEKGDPNIGIADVMIASKKAGIAFQATLHVRNKIVTAYQDIMSMPI